MKPRYSLKGLTCNNICTLHYLIQKELRDGDPQTSKINGYKTLEKKLGIATKYVLAYEKNIKITKRYNRWLDSNAPAASGS